MENIDYVPDWAKKALIYHIYPLGFFGAPKNGSDENEITNRLTGIRDYYTHFQKLGVDVIQFGPIFESVSHGYDTTDYMQIDHRLGTNELFKQIVDELHDLGINVIVDGVFNHVGREFASFKDIRINREKSLKKHWHFIDFTKDSPYNDGFDYQNWEGHYRLVKLNLIEREVKNYLFSVVEYWLRDIEIDGWRLDVAYMISPEFWREFRQVCKTAKPDCFLIGEMIHGPYNKWVSSELLDAGTGYQNYKSIWSAINSNNMYELKAVLEQSFHPEWGQLKNIALMNFLGNHDTTRIHSILEDKGQLIAAFLILFTLNGIPKIYYGDEIGMKGIKTEQSDEAVRKPMVISTEKWPSQGKLIFDNIVRFAKLRKDNHALVYGNIIPVFADNNVLAFLRRSSQQTLLVVINTGFEKMSKTIPLWNQNLNRAKFMEILDQGGQKEYRVQNKQLYIPELYPCWGRILQVE
ncbi:MAG: alpha-amylase family glycosyl hydrolase [Candidatus Hermodarchaeota archaeon]